MHRRVTLAAVAAGSIVTLLSACGTPALVSRAADESSTTPKSELAQAAQQLTKRAALTMTVSLRTTPAQLEKLAADGSRSAKHLTATQAAAIAGAHLTVEEKAPRGQTIAQAQRTPGAVEMSVTAGSGSTSYFAFRSVNSVLYLQVDLKDLLTLGGQSAEFQKLRSRAASLPPFVQALVAGKWVSMSVATLTTIETFAASMANVHLPSAAQLQELVRTLTTTVLSDVRVSRLSSGTTDHLLVAGNSRRLATAVMAILTKALPKLGASTPPATGRRAPKLPNRTVHLDAFVSRGTITRLSFDLGQLGQLGLLANDKDTHVPLNAAFSAKAPPITAPSGATQITLADLAGLVGDLGAAGLHLRASPPSTTRSMR
jgi:hypothetical protein